MVTGSALRVGEGVMWASSCLGFSFPLPIVSNICFLLSDKSDWSAWMWWIKYLFSRNVTAQSHLDLKVWSCHTLRNELLGTASVNLSNVLKNNGGKSTYEEGVADVVHLCGWGEELGGMDFSQQGRKARYCRFLPDGGPQWLLPLDAVWSFRKAEHFCWIQPPLPGAVVVGYSDVSSWYFVRSLLFLCLCPPFSSPGDTGRVESNCEMPPADTITSLVWVLEQNKGTVCTRAHACVCVYVWDGITNIALCLVGTQ